MDEEQDGIIKRQRLRAEAMMEKTKAELDAYTRRAEYLRKVEQSGDKVERSRWREKLPQLPEWKLRRKRKRELRRLGKPGRDGAGDVSESERSDLDTDLEDAFDGADETVPRCKRIITMSAKKKKGKKKSSGGFSEQMLRELVTLDNYEYAGKKRTESDEELEARMRGKTQEADVILETQFDEELE